MIYVFIFIFLIFLSEFLGYCWHRWGTHQDIIPTALGIQSSHLYHHMTTDDSAYGDFIYILVFLIFYFILILYLVQKDIISLKLGFIIYLPIFIISFYNYYVHAAYHCENHWLNQYDWFRNDKKIHFQHHRNPETNYGIVTHFSDIILETFDYGLLKNI